MTDIILFFVGIVVGAMNAIAGGGMLLGFPVMVALGISPIIANATTGLVVLPGNIAASFGYRKYLKRVPRRYLFLLLPAMVGAAIGTVILRHTPSDSFERLVPWLILMAVLLFAFQPWLHNYIHKHLHGPKRFRQSIRPLYVVALAVFPLSIYAGYFGAGFGFIMLAFLSFTKLHDHMHRMNALKNITAICISAVALVCLLGSGLIDWRHGLIMAAGNLIGGYSGSIWAQKVSSHSIRVIVIILGIISAAWLSMAGEM
jgi:uncharacterized protein